ncbi:HlyC/CorC family transporter [Aminithiophilus ramosus]|uniref:HlyC/CorC family transporter n=1 Tax=Aminithiophilus ramosus TaxID=3029084 RepID=A0A9Q7AAP1_9BACT|nr:hemolysin family protein [Aminithiophilus ramosus]QTX31274.1 HlyC/CorC family transporter [Aminithiophilus ramosus]
MESDTLQSLLLLLLLLLLSALFSSTETSITAVGRGKLMALQERHPGRRRFLAWLADQPQRALTVTLVANNLVNIAASAMATSLALRLYGQQGPLLAVVVMTVLIVIFGEILPKSIAIVRNETILVAVLPMLRFLSVLFSPLLWLTVAIVRGLGKLLGIDLVPQHAFVTREEIEQMVNIGGASGALEEEERKMIHGVISFEETRAYEVMVPRTDMVALARETTLAEAVEVILEHGHSRVPIIGESLDQIVGILYVKDLLRSLVSGDPGTSVEGICREALFVPETMRIAGLFSLMRGNKVHMAIVVDEYGGTAGILTLEDLLEEIVGEIQDEYDEETPSIIADGDGSYLVQGGVNLEDLSDRLGYSFTSDDVESVAGFIISLAGRFPDVGQRLSFGDWDFEVLEVEDHRVKLLRLLRRENKGSDED